jgi:ubiquitin carboxyl-terminal hydrolase 5/13
METITELATLANVASPSDVVWNEECAYTFHSPYTTDQGIVVDLNTFVGTCQEMALTTSSRGIFVRIVKRRQRKENKAGALETVSVEAPTKLALGVEGGFTTEEDQFETVCTTSVVVLEKVGSLVQIAAEIPYTEESKGTFPTMVAISVDSILNHAGNMLQQDVKTWQLDQDDIQVSKYAENLPFVDNGVEISPDPKSWKCESSGATEKLWLNLSDGYIGGGRKNWDGSGGSNGALDHFKESATQYPLVVKLGTITADLETADCYSYAPDEDGPVRIPNLAGLLEKRGIKVSAMQKTVKSTAELEVELNANYAFDAITEAGANLTPVSGPGLQGLQNLGNSCYLNSVMQVLMAVPELSKRYGTSPGGSLTQHNLLQNVPPKEAAGNLLTQTTKLASALTSGLFAHPIAEEIGPDANAMVTDPKYRLAPRMLKNVVGKNHVDFCTGQQQDAAQFLQYYLELLELQERKASARLTKGDGPLYTTSHLFGFRTTSRLECQADQAVKYKDSATETIWSLRIPMEKAVVPKDGDKEATDVPEQKRLKADDEEPKPVPRLSIEACLDSWASETTIDGLQWSHLGNAKHSATQKTRLTNFPRYIVLQAQRYTLGPDWSPIKLEVSLDVPDEMDLSKYKFLGPLPSDRVVPAESADTEAKTADGPTTPAVDEAALAQLMDMGFSLNSCKRALTAVGGNNIEAAMGWVFEHNTDSDFNDPLPDVGTDVSPEIGKAVAESAVQSLADSLGCFSVDQVRVALEETNGAPDRAADWLFSHMDDLEGAISALKKNKASVEPVGSEESVSLEDGPGFYRLTGLISHIGKNTGSGHYVAHLKKGDKWIIFNDEKVAVSELPPKEHAYLYLLQRTDTIDSPHESY